MNASGQSGRFSPSNLLTPIVLVLVGLWTMAGSGLLGFSAEWAPTILRVLIGILFVFMAGLMYQLRATRMEAKEVYQALNQLLYGKNYRRDREAIRILLTSLGSKNEQVSTVAWQNLKKLTGQNFARDLEVWESWWRTNEKRFAVKAKRPEK